MSGNRNFWAKLASSHAGRHRTLGEKGKVDTFECASCAQHSPFSHFPSRCSFFCRPSRLASMAGNCSTKTAFPPLPAYSPADEKENFVTRGRVTRENLGGIQQKRWRRNTHLVSPIYTFEEKNSARGAIKGGLASPRQARNCPRF